MRKITEAEYQLVSKIIYQILPAYQPDGKLAGDDYYNNIILNRITKKEYQMLEDF